MSATSWSNWSRTATTPATPCAIRTAASAALRRVQTKAEEFRSLRWADEVGRDANSNGNVTDNTLRRHPYDINDDGVVDWFVILTCPDQRWGTSWRYSTAGPIPMIRTTSTRSR